MGSINYRDEVQSLVEYRAGCLWLGFWDFAWRTGNEAALVAATTVLADVASLAGVPLRPAGCASMLAAAAAARDPAPLRLSSSSTARRWRCPGASG